MDREQLRQLYCIEKKTTREIADLCGLKSKSAVGYWLKKHNIATKRSGGKKNFDDLTGRQFGRLTVLYRSEERGVETKWVCRCLCGTTKNVGRNALVGQLTSSCGCLRREVNYKGCGDLSHAYWNRILKGAAKRRLEVTMTIEDAWRLFQSQNGKCALSGADITLHRDYTRQHSQRTASLDRKDHSQGYTLGNVQWVHRTINMMRRTMSIEEFTDICRKVASHVSEASNR